MKVGDYQVRLGLASGQEPHRDYRGHAAGR